MKIGIKTVLDQEGYPQTQEGLMELVEEIMTDERNSPALCSEGCEVEPDGHCPHGHPSIMLVCGMC